MSQIRTNSLVPAGGIPAGASGGGIIQCVQSTSTSLTTGSSNTYVVCPATVSITPRSSSNKVMVMFNFSVSANASSNDITARIKRDTTVIGQNTAAGYNVNGIYSQGTADSNWFGSGYSICYLDSPGTTSSVTYSAECYLASASSFTLRFNHSGDSSGTDSWVTTSIATAMEVSG